MSKNLISLKVNCPSCGRSLMDYTHFLNAKPSIKLHIALAEKEGTINLCSSYGCYEKISNIELVDNEVAVLTCPYCKKDLPVSAPCKECGAPIVNFDLEKGGKVHEQR